MNVTTRNKIYLIKKELNKNELTAKQLIKKTKIAQSTIYRLLEYAISTGLIAFKINNKLNKNKIPVKIYFLIK